MAKLKKEAQQAEQPAQTDAPVQGIQDDTATDAPGERVSSAEAVKDRLSGKNRMHFEGLGMPWAVLLGANPANLMSQVIATVLNAGGTRPTWRWQNKDSENNVTDYVLMAWPKEEPVRAAVLVAGPEGDKMHPVDAFPLLQGLPNDLTVAEVHPWKEGHGANVAAQVDEDHSPMWFYDPLYERDRQDLTEGVMQTFLVAGLAFSVRKALLDELTITQGPYYESHAAKWLEENPGKGRLDVPPLKIPMAGRHLIFPGRSFGEYELRARIMQVEEHKLDKMPVWILYLEFPFEEHQPLILPVYAPKSVLKDYVPAAGDEIDAYVWLQGRVIDMEDQTQPMPADLERDMPHPAPVSQDK